MVKSSSSLENEACCSKTCKKNTDSLNSKITNLSEKLDDSKNMLYHYKLGLSQVKARLVEFKNQEIKFCEKITGLEFSVECKTNRIESLTKELEELKKEKEVLCPSPPAQVYSPLKKDMSWTGLPEFVDDTITDNSMPSPAIESNSDDFQNRLPSVAEIGASSSTILSKPAIKFVKSADRPTETKTDKVETIKKPSVKYAEMYKKTSKRSNVRDPRLRNIKWYQSLVRSFDHEKNKHLSSAEKDGLLQVEFSVECKTDRIEYLTKELEELKKEKEVLFPPPAQVYSPPKKDMSWTGLPEFADDTITDYSRPTPAIEIDRPAERPTTDRVETAKKPAVKYAEMYRRTSKSMQTQTSNTFHNAIMEAGSKDRPPMLAPGNYIQWKSRIKRYIDTKPNHELIHFCLTNPPYELGWKEKSVLDSEGNPTTATERVFETYKNVKQEIRDQLNAEAEAVEIIFTGIDNDIHSTIDACPNACEM
nr:hypothetical protein [Tanacetum cinerariifolium]